MNIRELLDSIKYGIQTHGVPWNSTWWICKGKIAVYFNKELSAHGNHVGIILAQKPLIPSSCGILDDSMYGEGVDSLIYFFKSRKISYKVYPCDNVDRAESVIRDPYVKGLWIFGHGTKNSLYFGANGKLSYSRLGDASPKDYIAQLHCNTGSGPSLLDLLSNGEGICDDGCRYMMQNRKMIQKWIDEEPNCCSRGYLLLKEHCQIKD